MRDHKYFQHQTKCLTSSAACLLRFILLIQRRPKMASSQFRFKIFLGFLVIFFSFHPYTNNNSARLFIRLIMIQTFGDFDEIEVSGLCPRFD